MKSKFFLVAIVALIVSAWISYPVAARWQENARRRALMDVPQSERALRVPTQQRLAAAFPNGSSKILQKSPQLILFSVEPREDFSESKHTFHDHKILGQLTITDSNSKSLLVSSLFDGLVPQKSGALMYGCFSPRHGIRAIYNGKKLDLLICFSCHQMHVYKNNKQDFSNTFVSNTPQPTFDQVLTAAHISISK